MPNPRAYLLGLVAAALTGCAGAPSSSPTPTGSLVASEWTLIDVRQPPAAEPKEVALNKYRLSLSAACQASMALDCNRGTGPWSATGQSDGTIRFGPIAATRALCADDGLGERLARDLTGEWPYAVDDGRLTIRTGGATYTFDTID